MNLEEIKTMTEQELRDVKVPFFKTMKEVTDFIEALTKREHDYGTCVYAMSLAAQGAFNYVASELGVTGFQASCADMDFIRSNRNLEDGFMIIDYNKLFFPQYRTEENFPSYMTLIEKNKEHLSKVAKEFLENKEKAHPNVIEHWKWLASLDNSSTSTKIGEENDK